MGNYSFFIEKIEYFNDITIFLNKLKILFGKCFAKTLRRGSVLLKPTLTRGYSRTLKSKDLREK